MNRFALAALAWSLLVFNGAGTLVREGLGIVGAETACLAIGGHHYGTVVQQGCDDCDEGVACGPACGPCCPPPPACGPLDLIFGLFNCHGYRGCGCGPAYWGECISDKPCGDPCDHDGNYVGRGCRSCGGGHAGYYGGETYGDGEVVYEGRAVRGRPGGTRVVGAPRGAYVARGPAGATSVPATAMRGPATASRGPYAPRIISETDEVVEGSARTVAAPTPVPAPTPAPRMAAPSRPPVPPPAARNAAVPYRNTWR